MRYSALASRYAAALFDIATEKKKQDVYLETLAAVHRAISTHELVATHLASPLVRAHEKEALLKKTLTGQNLEADVVNFILLLAKKGRLHLLGDVVAAYQAKEDEKNNVTRGTVLSATELSADQIEGITKTIEKIVKRKVILKNDSDSGLIGGVVARVGSYTFDDTLVSHLQKLKEDLTRRIN